MGFSRQEHWSGLPFPSPGALPDSEIKPGSPVLAGNFFFFFFFTAEPPRKASPLPKQWHNYPPFPSNKQNVAQSDVNNS